MAVVRRTLPSMRFLASVLRAVADTLDPPMPEVTIVHVGPLDGALLAAAIIQDEGSRRAYG